VLGGEAVLEERNELVNRKREAEASQLRSLFCGMWDR
jgi:hypothetical protein